MIDFLSFLVRLCSVPTGLSDLECSSSEHSEIMTTLEQGDPVHPLRVARVERGWTQQKLADLIGGTALEVGRWERWESTPQHHYRERLCQLFKKTEEELGIQRAANKRVVLSQGSHFSFNENLVMLEDFYGRERERARLVDRVKKRGAISIVGPRRIGKTWLVQYLSLAAPRQLGSGFRLGYLDVSALIDLNITSFTEAVFQRFGLSVFNSGATLMDLRYSIRTLPASCIPVLCIDKFELLIQRQKEFPATFYQELRSMGSDLVLIVLTRKSLAELFAEDLTSPFSVGFEQITLRPFNRSEAGPFIEKKVKDAGLGQGEQYFWEFGEVEKEHWSPVLLQGIGKLLEEDKSHYNLQDPAYRAVFEERFQDMRRGLGSL